MHDINDFQFSTNGKHIDCPASAFLICVHLFIFFFNFLLLLLFNRWNWKVSDKRDGCRSKDKPLSCWTLKLKTMSSCRKEHTPLTTDNVMHRSDKVCICYWEQLKWHAPYTNLKCHQQSEKFLWIWTFQVWDSPIWLNVLQMHSIVYSMVKMIINLHEHKSEQ